MTRTTGALFILAALLLLFALNSYQLRSSTEPRVAGAAAEMLIYNDWVVPKLNGKPFLEKPPLSLWLDSAAMRVLGVTPLAARLASALAGLGTALLVFGALLRLGRPRAEALLAGAFLVTMAAFWSNARQVGEDALLTLGTTLALASFLQASLSTTRRRARLDWAAFALGIAIATLSKGVLGLALPGVVIFAYLAARALQTRRLHIGDWLRPALAALIGLIPVAIWLYFLYQRGGIDAVSEIILANSVGRFAGDFENGGHFEPFYYYLAKLPEVFQPWTLLVLLGLWLCLKKAARDRTALFFSCWLLAPFVLLSLSSGKRMVYLLALYPAAAVIAAHYCAELWRRLRAGDGSALRVVRGLLWLYGLALSALAIALTATLARQQAGLAAVIGIGLLLLICAAGLWQALRRRRYPGALAGCIAMLAVAYLAYAALLLPTQDRSQTFLPLFTRLQALQASGHELALYQPSERLAGAAVFYLEKKLPVLRRDDELDAYLNTTAAHIAVLEAGVLPALPRSKIIETFTIGKRDYYILNVKDEPEHEERPEHQEQPDREGST